MAKSNQLKTPNVYQIIANTQVQQAQQNAWNQKVQADYEAWQKAQPPQVDDTYLQKVQSEYDAWLNSQQPAQPAQPIQEIPQDNPKSVLKGNAIENGTLKMYGQKLPTLNDVENMLASKNNPFKDQAITTPGNLVNSSDARIKELLDPSRQLTKDEKKEAQELARSVVDSMDRTQLKTDADKEKYANAVNLLNKTNKFTSAAQGALKPFYNMARGVKDLGRKLLGNPQPDTADESAMTGFKAAQTQNPLSYNAGNAAGMIGAYALTNGLFDKAAALGGASKVGRFAANQAGQLAQDVAIDLIPYYKELKEDGKITPEELNELLLRTRSDIGANLAMGSIPILQGLDAANIKYLTNALEGAKGVDAGIVQDLPKFARDVAQTAEIDELIENVNKQQSDALAELERLSKQAEEVTPTETLPQVTQAPVEAPKPIKPIENTIPEIKAENEPLNVKSEVPKNTVPDYVANPKLSDEANEKINGYLFQLEQPFNEPGVAQASAKLTRQIKSDEGFKAMDDYLELSGKLRKASDPEQVADIQNQLAEIRSGLKNVDKAERTAVKDLMDLADVENAITEYRIALNGEDKEAVTAAANKLDAARNRIARRKTTDKALQKAFGGQYGPIVKRPLSEYPNFEATDDMLELIEGTKGIAVDVSGPRPYAKNQGVSPSIENAAEELANEMESAAKTQQVEGANPLQTFAGRSAEEEMARNLEKQQLQMARNMNRQRYAGIYNGSIQVENPERALRELDFEYNYINNKLKEYQSVEERAEEALDNDVDMLTEYLNSQRNNTTPEVNTTPPEAPAPARQTDNTLANQLGNNNNPPAPPSRPTLPRTEDEWKISKARTNAYERLGYGEAMPEKDYAYRVESEKEQNLLSEERYKDSKSVFNDLMNRDYAEYDEMDVKAAYKEIDRLFEAGNYSAVNRLGKKESTVERGSGRILQAKQESLRDKFKNTSAGAVIDAIGVQVNRVANWVSKNQKTSEGNSRIAQALADMGNKWKTSRSAVNLTHDQIKAGVLAEIEKEYGSVEDIFNDNDLEFLTDLAEDKSIPVWQITDEIEHRLNTGKWYTLDESLPVKEPKNKKLQNALNSLLNDEVRAEASKSSLDQIKQEVRNTINAESASFKDKFTDDDMDYLANLIDQGADKAEITDALNTKLATGKFGISDDTLREVNNIFGEISKYDPNSKKFVEGQMEAYRLLANDILDKATAFEKFEAWRYLAMLGNPKTMIRNAVGNTIFNALTSVSNGLAGVGEAAVDRAVKATGGEGIQRTKTIRVLSDPELIKASAKDADLSRYRQISGSKYEKFDKQTLRQAKSVFDSKLIQLYEKATDAGISDYRAVKRKYSTSLAGYLKANGYGTDIFKAEEELARLKNLGENKLLSSAEKAQIDQLTKDVENLEKARDYALKQAEYATFHEDNKMASTLSEWSRISKKKGTGIGSMFIEGIVPFKKTPANVLKSGVQYSPLGAIESIRKTGKLIYENTGKRAGELADTYKVKNPLTGKEKDVTRTLASDVIESWSRTLTGTGMTALGYYLYNKGIIHSSEPDTKYQDQLEGHQNYAIEINGKSYTIDWAAPAVMPLMLGAEIAKTWPQTGKDTKDFYDNVNEVFNTANKLANPIIETSMMSGVKDALETAANATSNDKELQDTIPAILAYNSATGYLTQAIPTVSGQIARTIDNTRRSTYTDKTGVAGVIDKQLKKQVNKLPGLSMTNEPYINTYGETEKNGPDNPLARLAYQTLSPGYLADINEKEKVSRQAYEVNKDAATLPKFKSSFKLDGERVSPKAYTKASEAYGTAQRKMRIQLQKDKTFKKLDPADQEELVKKVNTLAEKAGMEAIDPNFKSTEDYDLYKAHGMKGLVEEYAFNSEYTAAIEAAGLTKTTTNKEIFKESGADGLKTLKQFQDYGKDNATDAYKRYEQTKTKIPSLTVQEYKNTVSKMDGSVDGKKNGQISQKEMLAYLNSGSFTNEEAQKLYREYGKDWSGTLYINKNGKWSIKNK